MTRSMRAPQFRTKLRWTSLAALFAFCAPLATPGLSAAQPVQASTEANHVERAEELLSRVDALMKDQATGLYRETHPGQTGASHLAHEWPFSQVHIGILDLAGLPGEVGARHRPALQRARAGQMLYWAETSKTGKPGFYSRPLKVDSDDGDLYYDDNEWVGLAAIQHWLFFKDRESLDLTVKIFDLVRSGWDDDKDHPSPGGVFWTQASDNQDRNTVSTMPAAQMGVRLYAMTGDRTYLDDALRYYRWTNATFQQPDGLYFDHVDLAGKMDKRVWTYNQGVPVGVNVLLFKATGETKYLEEAKRIAEASYAHFITGKRLHGQPPAFNAIYFKNLLLLESVTGGSRYRDAMKDYADWMWTNVRDPKTGLFMWKGNRDGRAHLIDQGAMIQISAVLAWDKADWEKLY